MKLTPTDINGVCVLAPKVFEDHRGAFVKTYHEPALRSLGIDFTPREEFYSVSAKDVVRGMHFQLPPAAHDKLVYCISGVVLDVVVDLRKKSGSFGSFITRKLTGRNREMLFIPAGCAHGFLSLADETVMFYQTSEVHSPEHDAGILWNSFGLDWPVKEPVLSERDRKFPALADFQSPF